MKNKKTKIVAGVVVVIAAIIAMSISCKKNKPSFAFETAKVTVGSVSNTVTATGTIQAIKTVAVGTQVSGIINKLYADFNSVVKKGQLLAELDKTTLLAALDNTQASLDDAQAAVTYQTANYNRVKALHDKNLVAESDYDQALYNYSSAKTTLKMAKSNYDKAKINLEYATIYCPIDGVVLNRAVDEGQTVAASYSTPTLFSIANDLTQMQVAANIDEADIGQVRDGQKVQFTVDAFSDLKFTGEVTEIRLQPTTTSNVVTYTVIVKAPNPDKKLMPGMTANITITVDDAQNALIIPVKAIQFKPDSAVVAGYLNSFPENERPQMKMPEPPKGTQPDAKTNTGDKDLKVIEVWVKTAKEIHPVPVVTGVTDGVNIEVKNGLKQDDEIIISMTASSLNTESKSSSGSPFMPHPPQDKKAATKK